MPFANDATSRTDGRSSFATKAAGHAMSIAVGVLAISVSWHSLWSRRIDDLDSAHHLMNGIYIHDVVRDRAFWDIGSYTSRYVRQYPALAFHLYPPVFPMAEAGVFLLTGGIDIWRARACVVGFGVLLALLFYGELCRGPGRWPAVLGVGLLLTTPAVALLCNQLMLEVPALALGMATVVAYRHLARTAQYSWRAVLPFVAVATAAVYTKQTIGFIFVALLIDCLANHRALMTNRRLWTAAVAVTCLLLPLLGLTLSVGRLNLIQSIGTPEAAAARGVTGLERWSLSSWLFYPSLLLRMNPLAVAGGTIAAIVSWRDRSFLKANALWLAWIGVWYVVFSYFIVKQPRFMALWVPPWVILTMVVIARYARAGGSRRWLYAAPVVAIAFNAPSAYTAVEPGFTGMDQVIARLDAVPQAGNIAYFGKYHQVFVPALREWDSTRQRYLLRGSRIMARSADLPDALTRFRVGFVFLDEGADAAEVELIERLRDSAGLTVLDETSFTALGRARRLRTFVNPRPISAVMADVPLGPAGEAAIATLPTAAR